MRGPLFKWFGSKWLYSQTLPYTEYPTIIEPFAGSAAWVQDVVREALAALEASKGRDSK
jgi:hypothetical protein